MSTFASNQIRSHRGMQMLRRIESRLPPKSYAACLVHACSEAVLREYAQPPLTVLEKYADIIAKGEEL